jgi:dihydrolipoamide dehydrogenase
LTETEANEKGIEIEKGVFPWAASGRALGIHREEGMTKLIFVAKTNRYTIQYRIIYRIWLRHSF